MTAAHPTPSQTIGPFFLDGMRWIAGGEAGPAPTRVLSGTVLDGDDQPVTDAMLEIWNPAIGWARAIVDGDGAFTFRIGEPSALTDASGRQHAPSLRLTLFARGLLRPVVTRVYLPDEPANESDPVLGALDARRRATLIAVDDGEGGLRFDVHLQGERATVFFVG